MSFAALSNIPAYYLQSFLTGVELSEKADDQLQHHLTFTIKFSSGL